MGEGRLKDIKETASDTVEILRQLGTPGVQETLDKAKSIAVTVKDVMEIMKSPEWVQNIDNIRRIVDTMNESSIRMDNTLKQLKESGMIDETKQLVKSARSATDSFGRQEGGIKSQDLRDMGVSLKEMLQSIKLLADELTTVAMESKRSGALQELSQTGQNIASTYNTVKHDVR
ncbi:MAG: hypothetical protein DA330_07870 [Nitrososphaera sp.]|nr:hypothetical protein [Nitrososphaera sp.]